MTTRISVETGSEYLLPFAKRKLARLKEIGLQSCRVDASDGARIFIYNAEAVSKGAVDTIQIWGGSTERIFVSTAPFNMRPFDGSGFYGYEVVGGALRLAPTRTLIGNVSEAIRAALLAGRFDLAAILCNLHFSEEVPITNLITHTETNLLGAPTPIEWARDVAAYARIDGGTQEMRFVFDPAYANAAYFADAELQAALLPYLGTFSHSVYALSPRAWDYWYVAGVPIQRHGVMFERKSQDISANFNYTVTSEYMFARTVISGDAILPRIGGFVRRTARYINSEQSASTEGTFTAVGDYQRHQTIVDSVEYFVYERTLTGYVQIEHQLFSPGTDPLTEIVRLPEQAVDQYSTYVGPPAGGGEPNENVTEPAGNVDFVEGPLVSGMAALESAGITATLDSTVEGFAYPHIYYRFTNPVLGGEDPVVQSRAFVMDTITIYGMQTYGLPYGTLGGEITIGLSIPGLRLWEYTCPKALSRYGVENNLQYNRTQGVTVNVLYAGSPIVPWVAVDRAVPYFVEQDYKTTQIGSGTTESNYLFSRRARFCYVNVPDLDLLEQRYYYAPPPLTGGRSFNIYRPRDGAVLMGYWLQSPGDEEGYDPRVGAYLAAPTGENFAAMEPMLQVVYRRGSLSTGLAALATSPDAVVLLI